MNNVDARVLMFNDRGHILLVLDKGGVVDLPDGESFDKRSAWGMPGGRSEPEDEDEISVVKREVEEETGIWPDVNPRIRVEERQKTHLKVAFIGYPAAGEIKINPEEILDVKWFPRKVLYDQSFNMYAIQRRMAQKLLGKLRR